MSDSTTLIRITMRDIYLTAYRPVRMPRRRDEGLSLETHSFRYRRIPQQEGLWTVDDLTSDELSYLTDLMMSIQKQLAATYSAKQYYAELPLVLSGFYNFWGIACPHPTALILDDTCLVCYARVLARPYEILHYD